ncbi:hypothetical protein [Haloferax sp. YSMS24]|uniref:hypothetical protein n=1 Tax=Haloferax sp. YSMS24 TaxID=3388425 RepID=UPI00398CAD92
MASIESATALLTAVSIGIAAVAVLVNNIEWGDGQRENRKELRARFQGLLLGYVSLSIVVGFAASLYYLYLVEFSQPIFNLSGLTSRHVFIVSAVATFLGIYLGLIGLFYFVYRESIARTTSA